MFEPRRRSAFGVSHLSRCMRVFLLDFAHFRPWVYLPCMIVIAEMATGEDGRPTLWEGGGGGGGGGRTVTSSCMSVTAIFICTHSCLSIRLCHAV